MEQVYQILLEKKKFIEDLDSLFKKEKVLNFEEINYYESKKFGGINFDSKRYSQVY